MADRPSPFESDDAGMELVALDEVTAVPPAEPDGDDFVVTVEEPVDDDGLDFELIIEEPAPDPARRCETVADVESAIDALSRADHGDTVLDLLAQPVVPGASLIVVFLVKEGLATAQRACGSPAADDEITALTVPLGAPSLLQAAASTGAIASGPAGEDHVQQLISRYLRAPEPAQACVAPVLLGRRTVNLICVQTTDEDGLGVTGEEALGRLASEAARSYLRMIRARRAEQARSP